MISEQPLAGGDRGRHPALTGATQPFAEATAARLAGAAATRNLPRAADAARDRTPRALAGQGSQGR